VIFISLSLTIIMNLHYKAVIGSDFQFHAKIAKDYSEGKNALTKGEAIRVNGGPYPPLFHLFFALCLLISTGFAVVIMYAFQVLLFPAVMAATLFLIYKKMNVRAAAFAGILMLTSIALFDRAAQATPQGIDMILFPLAVYFFLESRKIPYIVTMSAMIYNHGIWSYLHFGALILYSLYKKEKIMYHVWTFIVTLPLFVITVIYLPGYMRIHSSVQSTQELVALGSTWYLIKYMGVIIAGVTVIYLIYLAIALIKKARFPYKLSNLEQIALLWMLTLSSLFFIIRDRLASYIVPPLVIILAGFIVRKVKSRRFYIPLVLLSTIIAMIFALLSWIIWFKAGTQVAV